MFFVVLVVLLWLVDCVTVVVTVCVVDCAYGPLSPSDCTAMGYVSAVESVEATFDCVSTSAA